MMKDYARQDWRTPPKPMTALDAAMVGFEVAVLSVMLILAWCGA
jgi:hypothetical protein